MYGRRGEDRKDELDTATPIPPWLVNNIIFCYDAEKYTRNDNERKQRFLQHKGNYSNNNEAYTDGTKSTGRKVGFAAVFENIAR